MNLLSTIYIISVAIWGGLLLYGLIESKIKKIKFTNHWSHVTIIITLLLAPLALLAFVISLIFKIKPPKLKEGVL